MEQGFPRERGERTFRRVSFLQRLLLCQLSIHPPGVLQIELWGGGKKDNFLFLETLFVLETGWKNPVKTQEQVNTGLFLLL